MATCKTDVSNISSTHALSLGTFPTRFRQQRDLKIASTHPEIWQTPCSQHSQRDYQTIVTSTTAIPNEISRLTGATLNAYKLNIIMAISFAMGDFFHSFCTQRRSVNQSFYRINDVYFNLFMGMLEILILPQYEHGIQILVTPISNTKWSRFTVSLIL